MNRLPAILNIAMAILVTISLAVPSLAFLTPPEARKAATWHYVAPLASIPDDGVPRQYPVLAQNRDAWTVHHEHVVGRVLLLRMPGSDDVRAFEIFHLSNTLEIGLEYLPEKKAFHSLCRKVLFGLDGKLLNANDREISEDMLGVPVKIDAGAVWCGERDQSRQ